MSFYDDASLIFLAGGAAGKDGKAYNLKPTGNILTKNLVDNGTFDSATNWVADAGWSIADGKASTTGGQISSIDLVQTTTYANLAEGRPYKLQYTVSDYAAGTLSAFVRGTAAGTASANGTYTEYATSGSDTDAIKFTADSSFRGKIDDVSIVEVESIPADFTFTRGTNLTATRVGKDGYIEKGRENLLKYSNTFNQTGNSSTGWALVANTGGTAPTVTSGQTGYDGSSDAWLLSSENDVYSRIEQNTTYTGVFTFSVYAKAGTADYMNLENGGITGDSIWFNLQDGSVSFSGAIDATITQVGTSGWYRCSVTLSGTSGQQRIYATTSGSNLNSGVAGNIYIQDAQFEAGLVATDYIETGATTATAGLLEDEPRFDYTGGGCPALLLEPTRTNLIEQSEYFDHTSWIDTSATRDITVTQVSETTPDGGSVAYKIQGTDISNQLAALNTIVIGDVVTNSIYVKRVSGTGDVRLRDVNNVGTDFSLSAADGWKRIDVTGTATSTSGRFYVNLATYTDEILVWGAQQEKGDFVTSYMPNYGAATTVTRATEVCGDAGDSSTFNDSQGTLYAEIAALYNDGFYREITVNDGGGNNVIEIRYMPTANEIQYVVRNGGAVQMAINVSLDDALEFNKVALKYKENDFSAWLNGVRVGTDGSGVTPTGLNRLSFNWVGSNPFYGKTKQVLYFPTALSNNDSEILTGATSYRSFNVMRSALNYTAYE